MLWGGQGKAGRANSSGSWLLSRYTCLCYPSFLANVAAYGSRGHKTTLEQTGQGAGAHGSPCSGGTAGAQFIGARSSGVRLGGSGVDAEQGCPGSPDCMGGCGTAPVTACT